MHNMGPLKIMFTPCIICTVYSMKISKHVQQKSFLLVIASWLTVFPIPSLSHSQKSFPQAGVASCQRFFHRLQKKWKYKDFDMSISFYLFVISPPQIDHYELWGARRGGIKKPVSTRLKRWYLPFLRRGFLIQTTTRPNTLMVRGGERHSVKSKLQHSFRILVVCFSISCCVW